MRFALLLLTVGLGLAAAQKKQHLVTIFRDEYEYKQGTPCPIGYVEPETPREALRERLSQGYKVCKKGNIANCSKGSVFHLETKVRNLCQECKCDTPQGGLYTAHCQKIDCADMPKSTPIPGKGVLGRNTQQACRRTQVKECSSDSTYMARDRRCVYCDETNKIDLSLPEYHV